MQDSGDFDSWINRDAIFESIRGGAEFERFLERRRR
jgi:hypothetical protein